MELFSFYDSDSSIIMTPIKSRLNKLSHENKSNKKSTSFETIDFPKKIKECDDKIAYYSREKEKLLRIINSFHKDFSSQTIKNTNTSSEKNVQKKETVKELEEKLDIVVDKYNCLSMKYDIKYNDLENLKISHKELREKCYKYKNKYENLLKVNNELKDKLIETEKEHILDQEEFKNLVKKNSSLTKKVEELKNENNQLINQLNSKNKRLEIYRNNKSANDILNQRKNQYYKNEQNLKLLLEEYKNKMSSLENENRIFRKKLEEFIEKSLSEKETSKRVTSKIK